MKRASVAFTVSLIAAAALPILVRSSAIDRVPDVLLSRQVAEQAGVHAGDTVQLALTATGNGAKRFRVAGVYEPTPDPMKFTAKRLEARLHLPDLNALIADPSDPASNESVGVVHVRLTDPRDATAFASTLAARAPGIFARPTTRDPDGADPFAVLDRFHLAIAIVTVVGSTAFLLALTVMTAQERRETMGILRLIGVSERFILLEVLFEGLLIAVAGALFGILVAFAAEGIVNRVFQWRYDTTLVFVRVTAAIALRSIAFAVPLGVVAGVLASWTLLRRNALAFLRR